METHIFSADRIFNEKGVSRVPNHPPQIVALKKAGWVSGVWGEGTTTTLVLCGSASGYYVPPLFIFPRVKNNPLLMVGSPPGSIQQNFPTGWIQSHVFLKWLEHFIRHTNSSKVNPSLLILDGHTTHTKNLQVLDLARDSGVFILCLPPHTTQRLQPLDVCVMKPLSTNLSPESKKFMFQNPGCGITLYHGARIFGEAYKKSCTSTSMISGCEKCGIFPMDKKKFDGLYTAASVTGIPINTNETAINPSPFPAVSPDNPLPLAPAGDNEQ